jgi:hypothetical protein
VKGLKFSRASGICAAAILGGLLLADCGRPGPPRLRPAAVGSAGFATFSFGGLEVAAPSSWHLVDLAVNEGFPAERTGQSALLIGSTPDDVTSAGGTDPPPECQRSVLRPNVAGAIDIGGLRHCRRVRSTGAVGADCSGSIRTGAIAR